MEGTTFVAAKNSLLGSFDMSKALHHLPRSTTDLTDYKVVRTEHELQLIKADHKLHTPVIMNS